MVLWPSCCLSVLSNDSTGRGQAGFRFGVYVPGGQKCIVKRGYNCTFSLVPMNQRRSQCTLQNWIRINVDQKGFVCGVALLRGRRSKHYISNAENVSMSRYIFSAKLTCMTLDFLSSQYNVWHLAWFVRGSTLHFRSCNTANEPSLPTRSTPMGQGIDANH